MSIILLIVGTVQYFPVKSTVRLELAVASMARWQLSDRVLIRGRREAEGDSGLSRKCLGDLSLDRIIRPNLCG